jgi:ABC-type Zn uptake system ZnuABC Zn-binding protein ZnuA
MKLCKRCNRQKPLEEMAKSKAYKDGYRNECKCCRAELFKAWTKSNPKRQNYNKQYRQENAEKFNDPEYAKRYYQTHKDRLDEKNKKWAKANRKQSNLIKDNWRRLNPEQHRKIQAARRARLLKATPKWADLQKIEQIYLNCPIGMEVDHVIPLKGKNICGLHIETNLQYLSKSDNCKKGNRF